VARGEHHRLIGERQGGTGIVAAERGISLAQKAGDVGIGGRAHLAAQAFFRLCRLRGEVITGEGLLWRLRLGWQGQKRQKSRQ
ncbi:MAG: hypothetical protein ACOVLI_00820, partial [Rhabdaerophilum sp.]